MREWWMKNPIDEAIERVQKIHDDAGADYPVRERALSLLAELKGAVTELRELERSARKSRRGRHSNVKARRVSELVHIRRYKLVERLKAQNQSKGVRRYSEEAQSQAAIELNVSHKMIKRSWKIAKRLLSSRR